MIGWLAVQVEPHVYLWTVCSGTLLYNETESIGLVQCKHPHPLIKHNLF